MVTKIDNARKSVNDEGAKSQSAVEAEIKTLTGKTKDLVTSAIKARSESFTLLQSAAAHAAYLGIVHGRFEQLNRLFNELPNIDADALRQKFMFRVNDKYAVDGVHERDEQGNELDTWTKRPTTMIIFVQNPANKGEHFSLAKATGEGDKANEKRKLIQAYRDKVREAGVEDLESIEWLSRAKVVSTPAAYDIGQFKKSLISTLIRAAKEASDPESGLSKSYIEGIMRAAGFDKGQLSQVRSANPAVMLDTAKPELKPETQTENRAAA
jgi:hypothetical protein